MLFVIISAGWHFLGQVEEASCSCFACTMARIHCALTRCPLVHIVNSCSPKHGLSWDQLVFPPSWWKLPYSQYWLLSKAKHKQEATTVSNSPFFNVHQPGTYYGAWHWAATLLRTTIRHYPKTNTEIWREQRLFPWLIWMATIYKMKHGFCTTRNLLRPKSWCFPKISEFSGFHQHFSGCHLSHVAFSKVGNCTFDF